MCAGEGHSAQSGVAGKKNNFGGQYSAQGCNEIQLCLVSTVIKTQVYLHLLVLLASVSVILYMSYETPVHLEIESQPAAWCRFCLNGSLTPRGDTVFLVALPSKGFLSPHTLLFVAEGRQGTDFLLPPDTTPPPTSQASCASFSSISSTTPLLLHDTTMFKFPKDRTKKQTTKHYSDSLRATPFSSSDHISLSLHSQPSSKNVLCISVLPHLLAPSGF